MAEHCAPTLLHTKFRKKKGVFFIAQKGFFCQKILTAKPRNSYRPNLDFFAKKLGKVALKKLQGVFLPKLWAMLVRELVSKVFDFPQISQFVLHQSWQGSNKKEKGNWPCQHKIISVLGVFPLGLKSFLPTLTVIHVMKGHFCLFFSVSLCFFFFFS